MRAVFRLGITLSREPRIASRLVKRSAHSRSLWLDLCELQCKLAPVRNPSTSQEDMDPQSKRLRLNECVSTPAMPLAPTNLLKAAGDGDDRRAEELLNLTWAVFGCDSKDAKGIRNVLVAEHSDGKTQAMVRSSFEFLNDEQVETFVDMKAFDVWQHKSGGTKPQCITDMWTTKVEIEELAQIHGENLRLWFCGRGGDRVVQSSMLDGWVMPTRTRPTTANETPDKWDELSILKSPNWEAQVAELKMQKPNQPSQWRCTSVCLPSTADGTGTYRAELWREGKFVTHFFIGIYPHPGSMSWGDVQTRPHEHRKFLNDLASGTPSQKHIVKFNADLVQPTGQRSRS